MKEPSDQSHDRAEAMFKRKQEQLRDAPKAMLEYQEKSRAVRDRTMRLREERLAREADEGKPAES